MDETLVKEGRRAPKHAAHGRNTHYPHENPPEGLQDVDERLSFPPVWLLEQDEKEDMRRIASSAPHEGHLLDSSSEEKTNFSNTLQHLLHLNS